MRANKLLGWTLMVAALSGVLSVSSEGGACGAAISWGIDTQHKIFDGSLPRREEPKPPSQVLLSAEKTLDRGDALVAASGVLRAFPNLSTQSVERATRMEARALRDVSVAIVRTNGATGPDGAFAWAGPETRAENLAWAQRTLRSLLRKDASDTVLASALGESLVARGETEDEGRELLEALSADDLIANAHGYRSLAKERAAAGDAEGTGAALERCRAMAVDASMCRAELPHVAGS
jgi:hypothetical protein